MNGSVTIVGVGSAAPDEAGIVTAETVFEQLAEQDVRVHPKNIKRMKDDFGIHQRWSAGDLHSDDLAELAASDAISDAQRRNPSFYIDQIGIIVHGTSTAPREFPATACALQWRLDIPDGECAVYEVSAACTSWVSGLMVAESQMRCQGITYGLVASGEIVYSANKLNDLNRALWGDGGGAVVLKYDPNGDPSTGIIGSMNVSYGSGCDMLYSSGVGTRRHRLEPCGVQMGKNGPDIQKWAVTHVPIVVKKLLAKHGLEVDARTKFYPHNGNKLMVADMANSLGIWPDQTFTVQETRGNMAAASIPVSLYEHRHKHESGDLLIFAGFGAGTMIGVVLYRWP